MIEFKTDTGADDFGNRLKIRIWGLEDAAEAFGVPIEKLLYHYPDLAKFRKPINCKGVFNEV